MTGKFFGSARGGLVAVLCAAFAQVGVAGYTVQVTAGYDKDKGTYPDGSPLVNGMGGSSQITR